MLLVPLLANSVWDDWSFSGQFISIFFHENPSCNATFITHWQMSRFWWLQQPTQTIDTGCSGKAPCENPVAKMPTLRLNMYVFFSFHLEYATLKPHFKNWNGHIVTKHKTIFAHIFDDVYVSRWLFACTFLPRPWSFRACYDYYYYSHSFSLSYKSFRTSVVDWR